MEDDLTLWKNIQNGDHHSLKILHNRYYYQMILYVKGTDPGHNGSDEVVSDCFIKLWTKRNDLLIERSVKAYLFLMLRNGLIDLERKKKRVVHLEVGSIPDFPDIETLKEFDNYARLYHAMEKLPEQRRRILEMAAFESRTYAQIADRLGISINTVKTQMGRAYQFLKEELDPKSFELLFMLRSRFPVA